LSGDIDGLVHLSDISWSIPGEEAVKNFKKGQEVEAVILAIDADRERISLGIKQLEGDVFTGFVEQHTKGSIVTGKVVTVEPKLVTVELAQDILGTIKVSELSDEKIDDATTKIQVGEEVTAKITNIDRKTRSITLSVKAKDAHDQAEAIKKYGRTNEVSTTLGDLFKEKISSKDNDA
jgi:small subunit ribosomal protein S1